MSTSDNRALILEKALELFAARGYDAVGVQEIVQQAGVTKPTLYHYFGSKQGLFESLLEQHHTALARKLHVATRYSGDLPLTLQTVASTYLTFAQQHPLFMRLHLALHFLPPEHEVFPLATHFSSRYTALFEELFIAAAQDHGNMRGRHQRYAWTFMGMINSYVTLVLSDQIKMNEQLSHDIVHQFSHGIYS